MDDFMRFGYDVRRHPAYVASGVVGVWLHTPTWYDFDEYGVRGAVEAALEVVGEICVSGLEEEHFYSSSNLNWFGLLLEGQVSHLYRRDCYSSICPDSGLRYPSPQGIVGGPRSEGFLDPQKAKLIGFYTRSVEVADTLRELYGLPVEVFQPRWKKRLELPTWTLGVRRLRRLKLAEVQSYHDSVVVEYWADQESMILNILEDYDE